jgi:ABC-type nitrate/sulfonate/bicarbonate transport system permease component
MCGRIIQASAPLRLAIVDGLNVRDSRLTDVPRRYNAAPSQELLVIRLPAALRWDLHLAIATEAIAARPASG